MAFKVKRVEGFIADPNRIVVQTGVGITDEEFKTFLASLNQKKTKFDSVIEKAVKWVAAESSYMSDVRNDLKALQSELKAPSRRGLFSFLSGSQSTKLVRKALKDFKMVGRCERREAALDKEIVMIIHELKGEVKATGSLHELEALKTKIETEARSILGETSFYEGGIKTKLQNIQKEIPIHERLGESELPRLLDELLGEVKRVIGWMTALTIDLRNARRESERYFAAIYPEKIFIHKRFKQLPTENKTIDLLRGEGAYKLYSLENRRLVWNRWRMGQRIGELTQVPLGDVDLSGLDLSEFDFRVADFRGANFSGTNLTKANLAKALLEKAKFNGAQLNNTNLRGALLNDAILIKATLNNCDLSYADCIRANLKGALITGGSASVARFMGADFTDARVIGVQMDGAAFRGAKLKEAKEFRPSVVSLASFRETGLKPSDLEGIPGVGSAQF